MEQQTHEIKTPVRYDKRKKAIFSADKEHLISLNGFIVGKRAEVMGEQICNAINAASNPEPALNEAGEDFYNRSCLDCGASYYHATGHICKDGKLHGVESVEAKAGEQHHFTHTDVCTKCGKNAWENGIDLKQCDAKLDEVKAGEIDRWFEGCKVSETVIQCDKCLATPLIEWFENADDYGQRWKHNHYHGKCKPAPKEHLPVVGNDREAMMKIATEFAKDEDLVNYPVEAMVNFHLAQLKQSDIAEGNDEK